jgi:hypothetical protein
MTKGNSLLAAASGVAADSPAAEVRAFAPIRTMGLEAEMAAIVGVAWERHDSSSTMPSGRQAT